MNQKEISLRRKHKLFNKHCNELRIKHNDSICDGLRFDPAVGTEGGVVGDVCEGTSNGEVTINKPNTNIRKASIESHL